MDKIEEISINSDQVFQIGDFEGFKATAFLASRMACWINWVIVVRSESVRLELAAMALAREKIGLGISYPISITGRVDGDSFDQSFVGGFTIVFSGRGEGFLEENFGQI